jgi:aromatic-L-amino-acid decarboxylase
MTAIGAQCMKWETSPAAAELEEVVMIWLRDLLGLPDIFTGVIQDTASGGTLCAMLTARERHSEFNINKKGFSGQKTFRVYSSEETHSSIEKGAKIMGLGSDNVVKVSLDDKFSMKSEVLRDQIKADIKEGHVPLCVVATIGTTGSTAIDPLKEIADICKEYNIWLHVDAAYAGSALCLAEYDWVKEGIEHADSFVFNPHKWLFTNFDCSAYFVKDKKALINTFEIMPEYLKTNVDDKVNNYCDWGIPLGRRFRALKLWFVLRNFGLEGIKEKLRNHMSLAKDFEEKVKASEDFKIMAPVNFNLVCFQFNPEGSNDTQKTNSLNKEIMDSINNEGQIYLTHTKLKGNLVLRMAIGQTNVASEHIEKAWNVIVRHGDMIRAKTT